MSFSEDPEVVADIKLRAATLRDSSRSREMPTFIPARITGQVPCRGRCGSLVDWTEEAEERFAIFNRILARKMEAPLDKTRIAFCNKCRTTGMAMQGERNRKATDLMKQFIVELKNGPKSAERERELVDKITKLGHPDVAGLVQAIQERKASKSSARRGSL
jgi:hypothetical protein